MGSVEQPSRLNWSLADLPNRAIGWAAFIPRDKDLALVAHHPLSDLPLVLGQIFVLRQAAAVVDAEPRFFVGIL